MKRIQWLALSGAATLICGCSTLPHFDNAVTPEQIGPRVSDIVNEIQCEILYSVNKSKSQDSPLAALQDGQYVANVNLTLDVTDDQGVNPALSYIHPYITSGLNFTAVLNGQLTGQQHRNFNVTFTLLFDRDTPTEPKLKKCRGDNDRSGLIGNLGIEEIIATGLRYATGSEYKNEDPYKIPALGVDKRLASDPLTGGAALAPNFGSTIDFTLVFGVGGGPNWTLTHFTGVNPAGLLSFTRTNKDTLVLSMARVAPTAAPSGTAAEVDKLRAIQAAGKAAQDNVTRMILQRLLPP
jgi:hypothetical protein